MNLYDQIARNKRRSIFLVVALVLLVTVLVYVIGAALQYDALAMAGIAQHHTGQRNLPKSWKKLLFAPPRLKSCL